MSIDYEAIREENLKRYGWDTAVLDLLGQLYSKRTHFIFELIQNAEDAGATELTFQLHADRLEVRHDGRQFTEADVRGICGVGKSTKSEDITQIGKFGIGFKSVYAYTRSPAVHSGDEHFQINNYVRPQTANPVQQSAGETVFEFPFDHGEVEATTAVEEISNALSTLDLRTLLFLRHVERLRICGLNITDAVMERVASKRTESSRHVALSGPHGQEVREEEWYLWERPLDTLERPTERVEVAFALSAGAETPQIKGLDQSPLVVFFPTEKETNLGFLIQGPYRTTPARDNIPEQDAWNQALVRETAALLCDVLLELRNTGLLTVNVLQSMPITVPHFTPESMFRPLFDAVRTAFDKEALIPLMDGSFGDSGSVRLARGAGLRDLLNATQLGELSSVDRAVSWVSADITENRTTALWRYLRDEVGIEELTPEWVIFMLTKEFLEAQPDEWVNSFYVFLNEVPSLWRPPHWTRTTEPPARNRPIIRLEDGTHVRPYDPAGMPTAYLPGPVETEFPTVRRAVAEVPAARQFLEALKFSEPDVVAEVLERVIPRYLRPAKGQPDDPQHRNDLHLIATALAEAKSDRRERLRGKLRETTFVVASNAATGQQEWRTPSGLYWREDDLVAYFDGNPDGWFAADFYAEWKVQLTDLGVRSQVTVRARKQNGYGFVNISDEHGLHVRGLDGFDPAATIDGLAHALTNPTNWRSEYVWNILLRPNRHLLSGEVESCSRQNFTNSKTQKQQSPIGKMALATSWLPGPDGAFHQPLELAPTDLSKTFRQDEVLARALEMVTPAIEEASRQLGLSPELLTALGRNPELVEQLVQRLEELEAVHDQKTSPVSEDRAASAPDDGVDYVVALGEAFDRLGGGAPYIVELAATGDVNAPELRRERTREAIQDQQLSEPARSQRFHRVARAVWEAKDGAVRGFLLEQYQGQCQICADGFAKRNGQPYFEGLYLVSRTRGQWVDRQGNVLCLCPTCCAKFQYGPVEGANIVEQILGWRTQREGGTDPILTFTLCGVPERIRFTEKHLLDLQEIVRSELDATQ